MAQVNHKGEPFSPSADGWAAALECSPIATAVVRASELHAGEIVWVNDSFADLTGYGAELLVGGDCSLLVHPDDRSSLTDQLVGVFGEATSVVEIELRLRVASGRFRRVRCCANRMQLVPTEEPLALVQVLNRRDAPARAGAAQVLSGVEFVDKALRRALDNDELHLLYQPKVSLATDRIIGVEALLRWDDPARGRVPPVQFVPQAEATGLIVPIGEWVLGEASWQCAQWRDHLDAPVPLQVAVNVSARQFEPHLAETVQRALERGGADGTSLVLEVTESVVMRDADGARAVLRKIKDLGTEISIDDFGTGYSSLSYLKRLPVDQVKIDQSFVAGLGHDDEDTAICGAIIAMAHAMGLIVVAEGIEDFTHVDRLRILGCDEGQGYLFGRPMEPADIADLLARQWRSGDGEAAGAAVAGRVLVVDDSAMVRQLVRLSLTTAGYAVYEAADCQTGVELARGLKPDVVMLDVSLPDANGTDVCRALRADPVTADVTVLMFSAHEEAEIKVDAFASGADDYLVKPIAPRDLVRRVEAALHRRQHPGVASPVLEGR